MVDIAAGCIEVYRFQQARQTPQVCRRQLTWQPVRGGPRLTLAVPEVLRGMD